MHGHMNAKSLPNYWTSNNWIWVRKSFNQKGAFISSVSFFTVVPSAQFSDLVQMIAAWMIKWDRVIQYLFIVTFRMTYLRSKHVALLNIQTLLPKYSSVLIDTIFLYTILYILYFSESNRITISLILSSHLSLFTPCTYIYHTLLYGLPSLVSFHR